MLDAFVVRLLRRHVGVEPPSRSVREQSQDCCLHAVDVADGQPQRVAVARDEPVVVEPQRNTRE